MREKRRGIQALSNVRSATKKCAYRRGIRSPNAPTDIAHSTNGWTNRAARSRFGAIRERRPVQGRRNPGAAEALDGAARIVVPAALAQAGLDQPGPVPVALPAGDAARAPGHDPGAQAAEIRAAAAHVRGKSEESPQTRMPLCGLLLKADSSPVDELREHSLGIDGDKGPSAARQWLAFAV